MRYLVYFEISTEDGNQLDFEEGGPGTIFGYLMNRFAPEAVVYRGRHAQLSSWWPIWMRHK